MPVEHGISKVIIMNSMSELLPLWVLCSCNKRVLFNDYICLETIHQWSDRWI